MVSVLHKELEYKVERNAQVQEVIGHVMCRGLLAFFFWKGGLTWEGSLTEDYVFPARGVSWLGSSVFSASHCPLRDLVPVLSQAHIVLCRGRQRVLGVAVIVDS